MGESILSQTNTSISSSFKKERKRSKNTSYPCDRTYPMGLKRLLKSRRTPNRLHEVYTLLECNQGWFSAEEINHELGYIKRTLQGILNKLVEKKIVKKTRSLKDARITLFAAVPVNEVLVFVKQ